MFETIEKGLTLSKAIKGISKSLNIANELIPIYKEFKPTIQNARKIISKISNNKPKNSIPVKKVANVINTPATKINSPKFFN